MKSIFNLALVGVLFSSLSSGPLAHAYELELEPVHGFNVPNSFAVKELYKKNSVYVFRADDTIFALGSFKRKFSLKTPSGKTISTARLYELVPENEPLLVIRNDAGSVLGYIHLENSRSSSVFKAICSTIYDKKGAPILKVAFPLTNQNFTVSTIQHNEQLIITTSKGNEGDLVVEFTADSSDVQIDPVLLLSVLHIHASKNLLTKLHEYTAIDEIHVDELGAFALATEGLCYIKKVEDDGSAWQAAEELVMDFID